MNCQYKAGLSVLCAAWTSSLFAAWGNANFGGSKDALGRYYFHDPANWSGVDPKYTTNATDPGFGLNTGTQWFTLADDFASTRLVIQAAGAKHGIDLAGHTLTLKGNMRSYQNDNGFTVSNGTLSIVNEYQVGSQQTGCSDPVGDYLVVTGPNTTFSAANLYLSFGTNNFCTVQDGATVNAKLVFGDGTGSRTGGNVLRVTGANTRFVNKVTAFNMFTSDAHCRNLLEVSGGAKFEGMDKLYFKGIENHVRFADNALPATPDTLSIIGGTSNVLEVAGSRFKTAGARLDMVSGKGHRISLQDGTHYYFEGAYVPCGAVTNSMLEITGGSVFARTNGNNKTSTSYSRAAVNNTIRIADPGSKFLFDAYVYVGEYDTGATMLVENGGSLEHTGRGSGSVYVAQLLETGGHALVVRGAGSKVVANSVSLAANGACNCRIAVSDHGVVSNLSAMAVCYWKRDPSDGNFSKMPGGTNVLSIASDGLVVSPVLTMSGTGNTLAVTNGELRLTSTMLALPGRNYALAIPDPIFETEAALAKLKTIPRDMHVRIGGTNSVIKTTNTANGNVYFAKNTDFSFEIPEAGYEQVPIQSAKDIEIVGCGKITVDAGAWIAAHPKVKVVLMQAAGSISIDAASLAAFNSALPPHYKVRLSGDGKRLLLTPQLGFLAIIK